MVGAVGEETEAWRLRRRAASMARTAMYTATATHRQMKIARTAVRIVPPASCLVPEGLRETCQRQSPGKSLAMVAGADRGRGIWPQGALLG
jgi:hypothetical protein